MDTEIQQLSDDGITVALTHSQLDITAATSAVKSPKAGAIVLFAGNEFPSQRTLTS